MTAPPLLKLNQVHAWYGTSHILQGVNFNLSHGQSLALMGRNGMGKSTLLRSIFSLIQSRTGEIEFDGIGLNRLSASQISQLGLAFVPEGRGIFNNLTVKENLILCARKSREGGENWSLEKIMEIFPRLSQRVNHLGGQLSGGEQQMLSISRALMTNPKLIILDEATEGLAPLIVQEIWKVLGEFKSYGLSSIIVDRNWHRLLQQTDYAIILQKGQIVLEGNSKEMIQNPNLTSYLGI